MGKKSFLGSFINFRKVENMLKEMSEDEAKIEKIVNDQILEVIKKYHPNDYNLFINENKHNLEEIKNRLINKHKNELKEKIEKFFKPYKNENKLY